MTQQRSRRQTCIIIGCAIFGVVATLLPAGDAGARESAQPSVAAQSAYTTATPLCGVVAPRRVMAPAGNADNTKPTPLTPAVGAGDLHVANGLLYVDHGSSIDTYTAGGIKVGSIPISWQRTAHSFAVSPNGEVFVQRYPYDLVKVNVLGQATWSHAQSHQVDGVFGHQLGSTWVVGAVARGHARFYDAAGHLVGQRQLSGSAFTDAPDGGLVTTDGRYVRKYDAQLRPRFRFGGAGQGTKPAAGQWDFYLLGAAAQISGGRYLVADAGRGIELFSPSGILLGTLPDVNVGLLTQASPIQVGSNTAYFNNGGPFTQTQQLVSLPLDSMIRQALQAHAGDPQLGVGAGVRTGTVGAYLPAGSAPHMTAVFDSWWTQLHGLRLRYTIRDRGQVEAGRGGKTRWVNLTSTRIRHGVSLRLTARKPGPYQVDVRLFQGKTNVSGQCLNYAVGAPGNRLDLRTLPGGADAGGVTGPRGAALADIFGTGGHRIALDWRRMLPNGTAGPTDFSSYDNEIAAASKDAADRHVLLSVQVGSGGPERAFVDNGTWGVRVAQLVLHWKSEIHYWEAWNEPNNSYGPAADYVQKVLAPFHAAVKATDSSAKVIGGTVLGMDLGYWNGIIAAGGLQDMDIAAIHPYPGHNRSWEEDGFPAAFHALRDLLAAHGAAAMRIWITELAWWSNGPGNLFGQGDRTARAQLWMHALGIPVWDYFIPQGTWGNDGVTFSLIEGTTLVKPSALAAMTERAQTTGRSFTGWLPTGMPHAYAEQFGARRSDRSQVIALWTDDVALPAKLTVQGATTGTLVDEYGAGHSVSFHRPLSVTLDGSVRYLRVPASAHVRIRPVGAFGSDVALATTGSVASATSSISSNPPVKAIDGDSTTAGIGDLAGSPAWGSAYGDGHPALTVTFAHVRRIDRVLLMTSSVGSVMPGIRSWAVDVRTSSGKWKTVARHSNLFFDRGAVTTFRPIRASAVRIRVLQVNFGGYAGGAQPWFWGKPTSSTASNPNDYTFGPAIIRELEVYSAS
jgi:hypothetical protein